MVSGRTYHAGDVIRSMAGKTIEVNNTDAEGRLTLVDAIHYAVSKERVSRSSTPPSPEPPWGAGQSDFDGDEQQRRLAEQGETRPTSPEN